MMKVVLMKVAFLESVYLALLDHATFLQQMHQNPAVAVRQCLHLNSLLEF